MQITFLINGTEHQKSDRQHKTKLHAIASFMLIATAPVTMANPRDKTKEDAAGSINVVYRLYKDYAWIALGLSARDSKSVFPHTLADENLETLRVYFDATLADLLVKEAARSRSKPGEVGLLDFDPIFASQDPSATDLKALQANNETILVSFAHPSSGQKIEMEYHLIKTQSLWKISDIRYLNKDRASLKKILSK
jgi:hypothetical protein